MTKHQEVLTYTVKEPTGDTSEWDLCTDCKEYIKDYGTLVKADKTDEPCEQCGGTGDKK